jgi:hypothetical protein
MCRISPLKGLAPAVVGVIARAATINGAALEPDEGDEAPEERDEADVYRRRNDLKPMSDS